MDTNERMSELFIQRGQEQAIASMVRVGVAAFEQLLAIHAAEEEELNIPLAWEWRIYDVVAEEVDGYPTNEQAAVYEYGLAIRQGHVVELHHRGADGQWQVMC